MNEYHKISEGILGEETIEKTNTDLFLSLVGQYFPEAIKDGEVDFTALKEEMGEFHEVGSEHYDFTWAGKQSAKKEAQSDIFGKTLKYKPQDSLNPDTTENIYIEGDNLEALKLLRRNYHGKIKMIYIDPPYNTGNDFVYHDDFSMTDEEIAKASGDIVDEVRYKKNNKDNAKYHTNWLNMMYPRLKIARDLLSDDGVIFISIDDNEQENLKKICDEVFGESNFIAEFFIASNSSKNNARFVSVSHEYMLCYSRNKEAISYDWKVKKNAADEFENRAKSLLNSGMSFDEIHQELLGLVKYPRFYDFDHYTYADKKGVFRTDNAGGVTKGNFETEIIHPITKKPCAKPSGGWRYKDEEIKKMIENDMFYFGEDETVIPQPKRYLHDYMYQVPKSLMFFDSQASTKWLKSEGLPFDFPKSINLMKHIISILPSDALILDFFSGSATTAHAVMQLNAEDGGNRKFIMVQLPEETDEKSEAYKAGYKNICEIGKERIRRAAKKIHEDNPDAKFDDGFKVFEVADTNIRWNTIDDKRIKLLTDDDYLKDDKDDIDFTPGHNDIDIVYEIMLRQFDIPLSTPIEKLPEVSDRTYIFANAVVVCLEPEIDEKLIEKLAAIEPVPGKFVLRDSAFNDDIELKDVSFRRLSALIASHQIEGERKNRRNNYTVEFI